MKNREKRVEEGKEALQYIKDHINYFVDLSESRQKPLKDSFTIIEKLIDDLRQQEREHNLRLWKKFKTFFNAD